MNCLLASRRRRQRVDAIADHSASAPTVSADKKGKGNLNFRSSAERKKSCWRAQKILFFPLDHSSLTPREMKSVHRRMTRFMISVVWNVCTSVSTWLVCAWSENMVITQASDVFLWRSGRHLTLAWSPLGPLLPLSTTWWFGARNRDVWWCQRVATRSQPPFLWGKCHTFLFLPSQNSFHKNT